MDEEGNTLEPGPGGQKQTIVDALEDEYRQALQSMDTEVKDLIEKGREMRALVLLSQKIGAITEIHNSLSGLYSIVLTGAVALARFKSERYRQLGHNPIFVRGFETDGFDEERAKEGFFYEQLKRVNFKKPSQHWIMRGRILTEIEYMIEVLRIVVEPDFTPLENQESSDDSPDRYVPSAVKIAVWRRDGGKCVECASKEKLEYDHIIPVTRGGSNTERNVQLLCEKCNRQKAAKIE